MLVRGRAPSVSGWLCWRPCVTRKSVVRHGDSLYVRSVNGRTGAWFRGTQVRHEGHIKAGGVDKDVTFVDADHDIEDQIDAAYRTKYRRYAASIIGHIVSPEARSTTIKLVPRSSTA